MNSDRSGEEGRGKILEEAFLRGFEGFFGWLGARWGTTKRLARVLKDLRSFWAQSDRPTLGTTTNEEWPSEQSWIAFGG